MSDRDFAMALAMLAEAYGEKGLTPVRIEAYHQGLSDVALPVLNAAVRRAIRTRKWFPKVEELRKDCEACRVELRKALPFSACESCCNGWAEVLVDGVKRAKRCECWIAHQAQVARLNANATVLALPAGDDDGD